MRTINVILLLLLCSGGVDLHAQAAARDSGLGQPELVAAVRAAIAVRSVIRDSAVIDRCSLYNVIGAVQDEESQFGSWITGRIRGEVGPGCERLQVGTSASDGTVWWLKNVIEINPSKIIVWAEVGSGAGAHYEETILVRNMVPGRPQRWRVQEIRLSDFLQV